MIRRKNNDNEKKNVMLISDLMEKQKKQYDKTKCRLCGRKIGKCIDCGDVIGFRSRRCVNCWRIYHPIIIKKKEIKR